MKNRVVLITGATSGIGKETARMLSLKGSTIVIAARDITKGEAIQSEIKEISSNEVGLIQCDLSSQKSIRACCEEFKRKFGRLDVLINNAGIWNTEFKSTPEGIEETFAVNVLAPYLMFENLKVLLQKSDDPRVITVSSGLHFGKINFNDIEFRKRFSGFHAYRQSKLAVILLTRLLAKKFIDGGISINCMHPGVVNTQLGRHGNRFFNAFFKLFGKSPEKGADTLIYMATSPEVRKVNGEYFVNRKVQRTTSYSYNLQDAERLLNILESKRLD
jgi:NAD(P)-dependent dehydrogenase (short-subunit alcohol dehydrogenase family)